MKAMILAAGLGTRLRPLTLSTPKALIPVHNEPLILYSLRLLKKHKINEVVINLHYLGELIQKELGDGSKLGMKIHYSFEPTILGTGGGVKKASEFFGDQPFFVLNSDVLIQANLTEVMELHQEKKALATMVLKERDENSAFTPVYLSQSSRIIQIGVSPEGATLPLARAGVFTGVQLIDPALLKRIPDNQEACIIRTAYQPAIAEGEKVFGYWYEGYWNDLGTMDRLRQAEQDIQSGRVKF